MDNCSCSESPGSLQDQDLFSVFADLRSRCTALSQIFIPDELWPEFQEWHYRPDTVALHRSMLLLAMQRGYLRRITSPVHRFLLGNGLPLQDVRTQYLQDLRERWMLYEDPAERHRKARMFLGRLSELQLAQWLELQDWTVLGLEARRQGPDIEACAADGRTAAFEVKFIGTDDADFAQIVESIAHRPAGGSVSFYDPADYLLFRGYEAAKQLQKYQRGRIAVIIIEEQTWSTRFALQVEKGWIDWANPSFFLEHDFEQFLQGQSCYPEILKNSELQSVLGNLTALWILTRSADFQYQREFVYDFE